MLGFLAGAIAGGAAIWLWGDELRRFTGSGVARDMRAKAADALQATDSKAGEVLDTARERVRSTLQAGEEAVRPKIS
jgi:hypothetical protein